MTTKRAIPAALERIGKEAERAGLVVGLTDTKALVLYPRFKGVLEEYTGDIAVEVQATLLGLRFDVYETCCGTVMSPGGSCGRQLGAGPLGPHHRQRLLVDLPQDLGLAEYPPLD